MANSVMSLEELEAKINLMANEQLESREYKRLYAIKFNQQAARIYILQRAYFVLNRRSCWAHVQGQAPFDVKAIIWDHEQDELIGDPDRNLENHFVLGMMEGEAVGLTQQDFETTPPLPGIDVVCAAWLYCARDKPWLEAFASSCILEIANSDDIVKGGGNSRRIGQKMLDDLGIAIEKQHSNAEHMVAEIEHANMLMRVAKTYGMTADAQEQIIRGAGFGLAVDRIYKNVLAEAMEQATAAKAA